MQAIITELLFQHALRIRVKAEGGSEETADESTEAEERSHLVGRLNNLVTSDLENLKNGNKFWLQLCELPFAAMYGDLMRT